MAKRRDTEEDASDDALAFRAAVRDVRPLPKVVERAPAQKPKPRHRAARQASSDTAVAPQMPDVDATVAAEESLSFRRPGVREQALRRLRRGLVPIDGELDLHGLHQSGARELLAEFIDSSRAAGRRCVLIIHGKGMRSGARGAVLKSAVNDWLRRHHDVMAFVTARPKDGGAGAVYALLRA